VALKTIARGDAEHHQRFEREALAVAALNHPNILTIYSVEEADGIPFFTMELVEGQPLTDHIPKGGMPLERLSAVAIPIADALGATHAKGITDRDLKPANIMVGPSGRVKILDFGLAKLQDPVPVGTSATTLATEPMTGDGRTIGTVAYMSPEQAEGKAIDPRSDLFSFGVILYELATGERPFTGDTGMSILAAIVKNTPPSGTEVNPRVPADLARVIRRCLVKDPGRRIQSAVDLRNELEELKSDDTSGRFGRPDRVLSDADGPPTRRGQLSASTSREWNPRTSGRCQAGSPKGPRTGSHLRNKTRRSRGVPPCFICGGSQ
jgi:serine/threonine protein kinase